MSATICQDTGYFNLTCPVLGCSYHDHFHIIQVWPGMCYKHHLGYTHRGFDLNVMNIMTKGAS